MYFSLMILILFFINIQNDTKNNLLSFSFYVDILIVKSIQVNLNRLRESLHGYIADPLEEILSLKNKDSNLGLYQN